ncbi:MAG: arabinofuranosyltransferase, partial [Microlunatus sp.]|nr:arabinofuranosyltransferase [Microlunatus sp.]
FGLVWYLGREWWAKPILLILGGVALYWGVSMISTVLTGHTFFLPKSSRMINMILIVAGLLTISRAAAPLTRRPTLRVRSMSIVAVGLLLLFAGLTCWEAWTPGTPRGFASVIKSPGQLRPNSATKAHLEILPDGRTPRFAPDNLSSYPGAASEMPADIIRRAVDRRLGPDARPMSLSADVRIYMYVHWYCYTQGSAIASSSLEQFPARKQELQRLSAITDPTSFADASAHIRFGGIDVFLLRKHAGRWWSVDGIGFAPSAFRGGAFDIVDNLPSHLVLAIRRPPIR